MIIIFLTLKIFFNRLFDKDEFISYTTLNHLLLLLQTQPFANNDYEKPECHRCVNQSLE